MKNSYVIELVEIDGVKDWVLFRNEPVYLTDTGERWYRPDSVVHSYLGVSYDHINCIKPWQSDKVNSFKKSTDAAAIKKLIKHVKTINYAIKHIMDFACGL